MKRFLTAFAALYAFTLLCVTDASAASSTKWRLYIAEANRTEHVAISEIEMHTTVGGADECTGGTVTASSQHTSSAYYATEAFDDDASSFWHSSVNAGLPQWIEYEFATAKDIAEVVIRAADGYQAYAPMNFRLEYWNGSAWVVTIARPLETAWSSLEVRSFSTTIAAKQLWRFYITANEANSYGKLAEAEMYTSIGGANVCTGGTAIASSIWDTGYNAAKAFDGNTATMWHTGTSTFPQWIAYEFASPQEIISFKLQASDGSNRTSAPKTLKFQYWGESGSWVDSVSLTDLPNWDSLESRTYPDFAEKTFWRLYITEAYAAQPAFAELELRTIPGGADACTGTSYSTSSSLGGQYAVSSAFDNNPATFWYSNDSTSTAPQWVRYDFANVTAVTEYMIKAGPTGRESQAPKTFKLQHNNGAYGWTDFDTQTNVSAWSAAEERTYTIAPPPVPPHDPVIDVVTPVGGTIPTAKMGTGTANATTFLRGDGTWAAGPSGEPASISIAANNGLVVTPNPITGTGTIGIDLTGSANGEVLKIVNGAPSWEADATGGTVTTGLLNNAINVKDAPYSAAGDGTTDDWNAIKTAFAALPASGGTVYFPPGTYRIGHYHGDGNGGDRNNFLITGRSNFRIIGYGAKIIMDPGATITRTTSSSPSPIPPIKLTSCHNVIIEGLEIDGYGHQWLANGQAESANGYGIMTTACSNVTIRNVTLTRFITDGISIGKSGSVADRHIVIDNVKANGNARIGISIIQAKGVTVRNSEMNDNGLITGYGGHMPKAGLGIEPNGWTWTAHRKWRAGRTIASGEETVPTTPNGYYYTAGGAGTTGATEPASWPTTVGQTTTDNGITWTCAGTTMDVDTGDIVLSGNRYEGNVAEPLYQTVRYNVDAGVGLGTVYAEKLFTVEFPSNASSYQYIDLAFPAGKAFWGAIDAVVVGMNNATGQAAGYYHKRFGLGLQANGTGTQNTSQVLATLGDTANRMTITGPTWDGTRWAIRLNQRQTTTSPTIYTVHLRATTADAHSVGIFEGLSTEPVTPTASQVGADVASGGGTGVSSVTAGLGLSGGTITSSGTIAIATTGAVDGEVLTYNEGGTLSWEAATGTGGGDAYLANNQTFTGTNTFTPSAADTNAIVINPASNVGYGIHIGNGGARAINIQTDAGYGVYANTSGSYTAWLDNTATSGTGLYARASGNNGTAIKAVNNRVTSVYEQAAVDAESAIGYAGKFVQNGTGAVTTYDKDVLYVRRTTSGVGATFSGSLLKIVDAATTGTYTGNLIDAGTETGGTYSTKFRVDRTGSLAIGIVPIARLEATGTPSDTTFLRGDGTWASGPGGAGTFESPMTTRGDLITLYGGDNIADGAHNATASGIDVWSGNVAANAIDGNDDTYFSSATHVSNGAWLKVTFAEPTAITGFRLLQFPYSAGQWHAVTYKIQSSTDDTNWSDRKLVTSPESGDSGSVSLDDGTVTARYWRALALTGLNGGWQIKTFQLLSAITPSRVPIGTNGQVLSVVNGLPAWGTAGAGTGDAVLSGGTAGSPQTWTGVNVITPSVATSTPLRLNAGDGATQALYVDGGDNNSAYGIYVTAAGLNQWAIRTETTQNGEGIYATGYSVGVRGEANNNSGYGIYGTVSSNGAIGVVGESTHKNGNTTVGTAGYFSQTGGGYGLRVTQSGAMTATTSHPAVLVRKETTGSATHDGDLIKGIDASTTTPGTSNLLNIGTEATNVYTSKFRVDRDGNVYALGGFYSNGSLIGGGPGGGVTQVSTGTGLTGGPITTTGTISLDLTGADTGEVLTKTADGVGWAAAPGGGGDATSIQGEAIATTNPTTGQMLLFDGTQWKPVSSESMITFVIDGGGDIPSTGIKGFVPVDFDCTVTGWSVLSDVVGNAVVDVKKADYSTYPTTTTIAGTEKPTLSNALKNRDTTLTSWTADLTAGDLLEFKLDSVATVTKITVALRVRRR